MNCFHTDFVYRLAEKQRRQAMAVRLTPAGKFWTTYVSVLVVVVSFGLAYWRVKS